MLLQQNKNNLPGLPLSNVSCPICLDKTLKSGFVNFTINRYISGNMSKIAPELERTSKQATIGNVLWKLFSSSTVNIGTASYSWFELKCYISFILKVKSFFEENLSLTYLYCTNVLNKPHVNMLEARTAQMSPKLAKIGYFPIYGMSLGKANVHKLDPDIICKDYKNV